MQTRSRWWHRSGYAIALSIATVTAWECAPMTVHSYVERGTDVRQYRTYRWGPSDAWSSGDPRLDNNRFFDERVRSRIEFELEKRGFEKTARSEPDVDLHYHVNVSQDVERPSLGLQYECANAGCGPQVYEKGILVIDLVDARTQKVVWRGWAEGAIEGVINNQSWMESRIDEVVSRILQSFGRVS